MGRVDFEGLISHFNHPHPMEITDLQEAQTPATCACCMLGVSGWAYACRDCCYHLHITCSRLPQRILHPADPAHPFTLLPIPANPEGSFRCNACGSQGTGVFYHCGDCGLNLHTLCASMPLSVTHQAHPHPLTLTFSTPYVDRGGFSCDICAGLGSNHWLYRCASCEFDAHIGCATARPPQLQQPQQLPTNSRPRPGNNNGFGVVAMSLLNRGGSGSSKPRNGGTAIKKVVRKFVNGAAEEVGQNIVQTVLSSAGVGGDGEGEGGSIGQNLVQTMFGSAGIGGDGEGGGSIGQNLVQTMFSGAGIGGDGEGEGGTTESDA